MSEQLHILHPTRDLMRDWHPGDGKRVTDMLIAAALASRCWHRRRAPSR